MRRGGRGNILSVHLYGLDVNLIRTASSHDELRESCPTLLILILLGFYVEKNILNKMYIIVKMVDGAYVFHIHRELVGICKRQPE